MEGHLSIKQVADILKVSSKTVRSRISSGQLAAVWEERGKGMSCWQIPIDAVEAPSSGGEVLSLTKQLTSNEIAKMVHTAVQNAVQGVVEKELVKIKNDIEGRADERDRRLMEVIRGIQERQRLPWWKKII
ncbi:helix-turn-helix domain-containing protein [Pelosinus propionicus]|uniref:Helix-turn-helix domain-containing protein n=1 Tax=Pelosinus propionicus DSM 13327 TaxID=1123291 RepID=A0A1I4PT77_9FIRM|nr:helix-turn-helix domain-containing protein [Pelosinus propionicus]SFM30979.1 Helix-turn-helix domain-containing protein [Pelosinus propionicus DSM 13327]